MKKLFIFFTLFLVALNLQSREVFIFESPQTIPNSCIHYVKPNRYVCYDNFVQVEFHDLEYVNEVFSEYKNGAVYKNMKIDGLLHLYAEEQTESNLFKVYALCKKEECVLIVSENIKAITKWLRPLANRLLIDK